MVDKVREIALKILYKIEEDDGYSNIVLNGEIKNSKIKLDDRDIGLISEIVYGTVTWKLTIDEIIKKYSKIRLKKISPWIINVLRMGVYQIIFLDKIPKSAAVNECVNLAKRYGHKSSSNFVNAILRKVTIKDYEELFNIEDEKEKISKTTSMPLWIIEELNKEKSIKKVKEICKSSNLHPNMSIRINNLICNKENLKKIFDNENIKYVDGNLKDFMILDKTKNIENNIAFKEGLFTIQDEGAGLIPLILDPNEKDYILDACSSPGGKTTYISELMRNKGKIEAWDLYEHRVKLVNDIAKRLKLTNIESKVNDATIFMQDKVEVFDKILLDVPCLGLGVLKRKPDIKWKRNKDDISQINELQYKILETCSKYLKKNGILVYSTCSILKSENEEIIEKFLSLNKGFDYSKIELKNENKYYEKFIESGKYIKLYQDNNNDGFFVCKLQKK